MNVIRYYGLSIFLTAVAMTALLVQARSYFQESFWEFSTLESHYTVVSHYGRLLIRRSPDGAPGPLEQRAWKDLKTLQNDQITFRVSEEGEHRLAMVGTIAGSAAADLMSLPRAAVIRPLLRGLDSPKKFAAADILLQIVRGPPIAGFIAADDNDVILNGYRLHILPESTTQPSWYNPGRQVIVHSVAHPSQAVAGLRQELRRGWHHQMDVRITEVAYTWLVLATLLLPIVQMLHVWRRRKRRRDRCCAMCGYDVRANADRCPECGSVIQTNRRGFVWMQ